MTCGWWLAISEFVREGDQQAEHHEREAGTQGGKERVMTCS